MENFLKSQTELMEMKLQHMTLKKNRIILRAADTEEQFLKAE